MWPRTAGRRRGDRVGPRAEAGRAGALLRGRARRRRHPPLSRSALESVLRHRTYHVPCRRRWGMLPAAHLHPRHREAVCKTPVIITSKACASIAWGAVSLNPRRVGRSDGRKRRGVGGEKERWETERGQVVRCLKFTYDRPIRGARGVNACPCPLESCHDEIVSMLPCLSMCRQVAGAAVSASLRPVCSFARSLGMEV